MTSAPIITIIVISYNTREMSLKCLRALQDGLGSVPAEVCVVDNASIDGSADSIRREFPQIRLIENSQNIGFGAANNQAMRAASGQYFMLLNSDAFVEPTAIASLLDCMREHPDAGVVGPRLLNADGTLQVSCYRFPSPGRAWLENFWLSKIFQRHSKVGDYSLWAHDSERPVDWLVGACMLVRREVFERLDGFDERIFMYAEESDWQRRIRNAGWEVRFTPAATVVHLGGASGKSDKQRINRHFFESLDYYELKHHGRLGLIALRAAMVLGCSMRAILWAGALLVPKKRAAAGTKFRMHLWLVWRQLSCWRVLNSRPGRIG